MTVDSSSIRRINLRVGEDAPFTEACLQIGLPSLYESGHDLWSKALPSTFRRITWSNSIAYEMRTVHKGT